jgi:transcription elongation factor GreA
MIKEVVMSREGLKKLEEELEYLKTVRRKEVAEKIKTALGYGDLSENSEYDEAKNEQAIVEGRIAEIEMQLKHVRILDENAINTETVHIGSKVTVYDFDLEETEVYEITGTTESNAMENKISNESPVGKALLKHQVGDVVSVVSPDGVYKLRIDNIA